MCDHLLISVRLYSKMREMGDGRKKEKRKGKGRGKGKGTEKMRRAVPCSSQQREYSFSTTTATCLVKKIHKRRGQISDQRLVRVVDSVFFPLSAVYTC